MGVAFFTPLKDHRKIEKIFIGNLFIGRTRPQNAISPTIQQVQEQKNPYFWEC